MKTLIIIGLLVALNTACLADYLVTTRKTSVKQSPSSQSAQIIQIEEGTRLDLLDDGHQTNGYYHVQSALFMGDGWIYRTFVRRYADEGGSATEPPPSESISRLSGNVEIRVVDVGAGLCTLIRLTNGHYIIYDAGHWRGTSGSVTLNQIGEFIPPGSTVELMVLSHTDGDHIGAAARILETYRVRKVLWGGYLASMVSGKNTASLDNWIDALSNHPEVIEINLNNRDSTIVAGTKLTFENTTLTFLCGFGKPETSWALTDKAEKLNSVSIIMKLQYGTSSVLFCGDAVGRHRNDPADALIATEQYMVTKAAQSLHSKIIIAPHHGADNGSSNDFIAAVNPETVIFSAGHPNDTWKHPRQSTAERYLRHGVPLSNMYRTDRGDDEGEIEWDYTRISGCNDDYGDDDIQIDLRANGTYSVYYVNAVDPCAEDN